MTVEMPDHFMGKPIPEDAIEIALAAEKKKKGKETQGKAQGEAPPLDGFIYVPSVKLHFAKEKSHLGKNWHEAHRELHKQKLRMPTIPEFVEFLKYLRADPTAENTSIYDEITEKRDPRRKVWLDAEFYVKSDELWVAYHTVDFNGKLVAQLEGHLMQDKLPGISLEDWLNNPTKQGLPQENSEQGDLWYKHPKRDRVARFATHRLRASFNCDTYPSYAHSNLGVFACAEKLGGKQ